MLPFHDWGGIVAWNYAIQKFGRLDKFVVMNCPHLIGAAGEFKKWRASHFVQNDVPDDVNNILKAWVLGEEIRARLNQQRFNEVPFESGTGLSFRAQTL
jgi:hypothetical protein